MLKQAFHKCSLMMDTLKLKKVTQVDDTTKLSDLEHPAALGDLEHFWNVLIHVKNQ